MEFESNYNILYIISQRDMDDTTTLEALSIFLIDRGFSAKLIQRSSSKTPDLCANDGENTYLFELKMRHDSKEPSLFRTDPMVRLNTISGLVSDATKQLKSMGSEDTIRMLWFLGQPPNEKTFYEQLRMTLYGIRVVVGLRNGRSIPAECYYAGYSDFYRYRDVLDGAILGTVAAIFINDFSLHADLLKNSRLSKLAGSAVLDPRDIEKSDDFFVLRDSVDRSNEKSVLQCLEKNHCIQNAKFERMVKFSITD